MLQHFLPDLLALSQPFFESHAGQQSCSGLTSFSQATEKMQKFDLFRFSSLWGDCAGRGTKKSSVFTDHLPSTVLHLRMSSSSILQVLKIPGFGFASLGDDFEDCGCRFTGLILLCLHPLIPLRLSLEMNSGDPVS
jgi:hypothetical protein